MLYILCFIAGIAVGIFPYKKLDSWYLKRTRNFTKEQDIFKDF